MIFHFSCQRYDDLPPANYITTRAFLLAVQSQSSGAELCVQGLLRLCSRLAKEFRLERETG